MHPTTGTCVYMLTPGVMSSLLLPVLHTSSSLPLTNTHALYKNAKNLLGEMLSEFATNAWMMQCGPGRLFLSG